MIKLNLIYRHPLFSFFVLTFIISWGAVLILFGSDGIPATKELQEKIGIAILLGPAIAGLGLILLIDGKKGISELGSRLIHWRVNFSWYALALFTAPLSTLMCIAILSAFTSNDHPAIWVSNHPSELIMLGLIGGLTIGLLEEIGWTGFATPRLLNKRNIYQTGILIGVIWGAWHFILFWENDSFNQFIPFLLLLARLFLWLPAYRILMAWVYKNTQSLLIIIVMHASLVASIATLDPNIAGIDLLIYILIRGAILWSIVAIVALSGNRKIKHEKKA